MAGLDETSEQVAAQIRAAAEQLSEAERIFREETTDDHRQQWPNIYRLEDATTFAQKVLALADPRTTRLSAATELASAATQAREAIAAAVDHGGGNLIESADRLLTTASQIEPGLVSPDVARNLEEIREEIEGTRHKIETQISETRAEVSIQKDQAFASINEDIQAVNARREVAEQQARELGVVTNAVAAENLAEAYAEVAKRTETQARAYTWGSIATYILSLAVAGIGIYTAKQTSQVETFVARAALGIPVALFGTYINSLASTHRREAWRLRHIELQIRTANPFLGLLETGRREETLAALAVRFFPGQEGVSFDGGGNAEVPELISLLRQLVLQQGAGITHGPSPPAAPQTPPQQATQQ